MAWATHTLAISLPRNEARWQECETISWTKNPDMLQPTDYLSDANPQIGVVMADRIDAAARTRQRLLTYITLHPGCAARDLPSLNARIGDVIDWLVDDGAVMKRYGWRLANVGNYRRRYRGMFLYAIGGDDDE